MIITRNSLKGLELADRVHSGIVHINDQTVNDEVVASFAGVDSSGTGARLVGQTVIIGTQRMTLRSEIPECCSGRENCARSLALEVAENLLVV